MPCASQPLTPVPTAGNPSASLLPVNFPAAADPAAGAFSWEPTSRGAAPIELLRQWVAQGMTYHAIGKRIGRDASTVRKRLEREPNTTYAATREARREMVRNRVTALWATDMTQREIAAEVGVGIDTLSAIIKTLPPRGNVMAGKQLSRHPDTVEREQHFIRLVQAGMTRQAARALAGVGSRVVSRLSALHKWPARAPGPRSNGSALRRQDMPPMPRTGAQAPRHAPPNPYRTAAQQAQIASMKAATYGLTRGRDTRVVPPPTNADQLIREAIAAGRVTRCPPRFAAPVNNGRGL
jgi:transposase